MGGGKRKDREESEDRAVGEKHGHVVFWKAKRPCQEGKQSAVLAWKSCSGDKEGTRNTWESSFSSWGMNQRVFCSCCIPGDQEQASNQVITKPCPEQAKNDITEQWARRRPCHSDLSTRVTSAKRTSRDKSLSK